MLSLVVIVPFDPRISGPMPRLTLLGFLRMQSSTRRLRKRKWIIPGLYDDA